MDRRIFPVSYPCVHVYVFISIYACTLTCYTENMESEVEMLKSIFAQLEYTYEVCSWHSQGVHFRHYLYIPEMHPLTGQMFIEREDEGHVFKVYTCTSVNCINRYITGNYMCAYAENRTAHSRRWP